MSPAPRTGHSSGAEPASGRPAPAVPRPSASLVLLDTQNRILLTQRTSSLTSFANAHVFPGGNLDPSQDSIPPSSPSSRDISYELCAIRETFEETGILLTTPPPSSSLLPSLASIRKQIHSKETNFNDFLKENGLKPDVDSITPFTTWVTPETMKKRYITKMFIAFLPSSSSSSSSTFSGSVENTNTTSQPQTEPFHLPTPDGGIETLSTTFLPASTILASLRTNSIILFPPQAYLVTRLSEHTSNPALSVQEQRKAILDWIKTEGVGEYVFRPRPEGKTKDGRMVLGYGPNADLRRKTVVRFGKGGMPSELEIVGVDEVARL